MHKLTVIIFLIIFLTGCSSRLEGPYKVIKVIDGDTIKLNNSQTLRMSGINTKF